MIMYRVVYCDDSAFNLLLEAHSLVRAEGQFTYQSCYYRAQFALRHFSSGYHANRRLNYLEKVM